MSTSSRCNLDLPIHLPPHIISRISPVHLPYASPTHLASYLRAYLPYARISLLGTQVLDKWRYAVKGFKDYSNSYSFGGRGGGPSYSVEPQLTYDPHQTYEWDASCNASLSERDLATKFSLTNVDYVQVGVHVAQRESNEAMREVKPKALKRQHKVDSHVHGEWTFLRRRKEFHAIEPKFSNVCKVASNCAEDADGATFAEKKAREKVAAALKNMARTWRSLPSVRPSIPGRGVLPVVW